MKVLIVLWLFSIAIAVHPEDSTGNSHLASYGVIRKNVGKMYPMVDFFNIQFAYNLPEPVSKLKYMSVCKNVSVSIEGNTSVDIHTHPTYMRVVSLCKLYQNLYGKALQMKNHIVDKINTVLKIESAMCEASL